MPHHAANATRTPRPRRSSTRRSSGSSAGEYEDIRYEKADGIAKITIDRPEVPQRLPAADAGRGLARRSSWPARTPRSASSSSPARASEAFCSGGDQTVRGDTGYIAEGASARPLPRHRPAGADAAAAEAGGGDGRRLRGRRRPHPPPLLRPDDRRRQRPLRADRAAGRLLGRRLRRLACCATWSGPRRRRSSGCSAASTTPRRRWRWAWSTRSSRSTDLERETVAWCREMLALSPFALRLVKASFNAHEDGYAGIQQLAHDANLLFYGSEEAPRGPRGVQGEAPARLLASSPSAAP